MYEDSPIVKLILPEFVITGTKIMESLREIALKVVSHEIPVEHVKAKSKIFITT